jgi:hypothetical protein
VDYLGTALSRIDAIANHALSSPMSIAYHYDWQVCETLNDCNKRMAHPGWLAILYVISAVE